ncbi:MULTISPECIES: aminoglycoside phosphotransferase family protein [unclassified Rhizobium]|uniref:aminoglycoside phosphotransferase family protein n=1 Tax=unclassified Rhizobium TaxID=2613769 RepID=UPI000AEC1E2B|nr:MULTISPECIES: aminoglycoside phosphotransferase family protein [unclassified Rhizobium]MBN8950624.1 aminoglycoside phosphotransferase family protein [Rhizobium tropici]RKD69276.1 aminoglycoside phosphotransferase (APT) family kinase protein [Rhizobium sp. WW_1]
MVRRLLSRTTPQWADLPVRRLASSGTDNAIYRVGEKLLLRLPRREAAANLITKELDWLPRFGDLLLDVPKLYFRGRIDFGLKGEFGIFEWMEGDIAAPQNIADPLAAALALASFLNALHRVDTEGAPPAGESNHRRGVALEVLSPVTLAAIEILADEIDTKAAMQLWKRASQTRRQGPPVWLHGDLKADNLIARDGKLAGVIDWGLCAVGDPAADYAAAWTWVDQSARDAFRSACGIEDADWLRAEGWALYAAVIALSYYRGGKNEALCEQSRLTLSRLNMR